MIWLLGDFQHNPPHVYTLLPAMLNGLDATFEEVLDWKWAPEMTFFNSGNNWKYDGGRSGK